MFGCASAEARKRQGAHLQPVRDRVVRGLGGRDAFTVAS